MRCCLCSLVALLVNYSLPLIEVIGTHTCFPISLRTENAPTLSSLGGPQPYVPVAGYEDDEANGLAGRVNNIELGVNAGYKRARVLCSYDAKDGTELNLTANEVFLMLIFLQNS